MPSRWSGQSSERWAIREFIALSSCALVWRLVARAQQTVTPVVEIVPLQDFALVAPPFPAVHGRPRADTRGEIQSNGPRGEKAKLLRFVAGTLGSSAVREHINRPMGGAVDVHISA
jgi:hypothetical protein